MKKLLFTFILFTFLSFQTKAQEDPICGIYQDGVKVTELTCYSFNSLTIVFPYDPAYKGFDKIALNFYDASPDFGKDKGRAFHHSSREIPVASLFKYVKGKYMVYEIISKEQQGLNAEDPSGNDAAGLYLVTRATMKYYVSGLLKEGALEESFHVYITALKGNGEFVEGYKSDGQYYRYPKWDIEQLYNYKVPLLNREKLKKGLLDPANINPYGKVDLSQPCTVLGNKVDFNNLGGGDNVSSNTTSSSNNNTTSINNTPVKTETPVKTTYATGKTIITAVAPTSAAAVKPLDKTKPGYFEEKSEDKKFMYRNGYQTSPGTYHGEVREYDNNTLEKIITYTNGVEDGLYVIFSDGKVEWAGTYKNGKKEGAWKHYKNGVLEETEKYVNGVKQE